MHILKYDSSVKALLIFEGLYWLHKANLQSLKLSDNNESKIRPIIIIFRLRSQAKDLPNCVLLQEEISFEFMYIPILS